MLWLRSLFVLLALAALPEPAHAQRWITVAACGTTGIPATLPGTVPVVTVDVTGQMCTAAVVSATITFPTFGAAFPATGIANGMSQGGNLTAMTGTAGNLNVNCQVGCSGGSFNNNADNVATSATNGQVASWNYVWDGTAWDRLYGDSTNGAFVNVKSAVPFTVNPATAANWGIAATGAAVPANGILNGMSQGGNLTALTGTAGNLNINCQVGCSGGSFNNNADNVATSSTNGQVAAWGYVWDGTAWDRLYGDSTNGAFVNIKASTTLTANPGTAANWGIGATGSAVPANAFFNGIKVGANLQGVTGLSLGSTFSQTVAIVDASGNQVTSFGGSGGTASNYGSAFPSSGTAVGFTDGTNMIAGRVGAIADVAAATNMLNVIQGCQYRATPLSVTDTRYQGMQCDVNGYLKVSVTGGAGINANGQATMANSSPVALASNQSVADPCMFQAKSNKAFNQNGTASVELVALSGSTTIYVCSLAFITAGATTVAFTTGTGTACATGNAAVIGSTITNIANSMSFAANGGLTLGNGGSTIAKGAASSAFCIIPGTSVYVAGNMTYVQQ